MKTIVALLLMTTSAFAQEHMHPAQDAQMHDDFYNNWMQPPSRVTSCCNKKDCYQTPIKFDEDGKYRALRREDGKWIVVPSYIIEQNQKTDENIHNAPDGLSHICAPAPNDDFDERIYCATMGAGQ